MTHTCNQQIGPRDFLYFDTTNELANRAKAIRLYREAVEDLDALGVAWDGPERAKLKASFYVALAIEPTKGQQS